MAASQRILLGHVKGDKGDQGDAATIRVAGTTTVDPGTPASVTEGGTPQARELTFNIPRGMPGTGGGAGANLRSTAVPLIHRIPFSWPFGQVYGAMDTLGWGSGTQSTGRVYYFTAHTTQGLVDGWRRTRRDPRMALMFQDWDYDTQTPRPRPMFTAKDCPINFSSAGYRGNWCRSMGWHVVDESMGRTMWSRAADFDGLVFTNSNRALWIYGRGYDPDKKLYVEDVTLPGLAAAPVTAMWAGNHVAPPSATTNNSSHIWVIQNNRLYHCSIAHNTPGVWDRADVTSSWFQVSPGVHRRITSAAEFVFNEVTDPALPTTMQRVYAEGPYAAVWGWTNTQQDRLAFFDGAQWSALTVPFNWHSQVFYISNVVLIFASGRLAVYNVNSGDYFTCDNPSAGAGAEFQLRYRLQNSQVMTNGWNRGVPQFFYRGAATSHVICAFDGGSQDTRSCYLDPLGGSTSTMHWPPELYCSTSRQDLVPSPNASYGYAYPWGAKVTYANISDRNTLMLSTSYMTPVWQPHVPMPTSFLPSIPEAYTDGYYRRGQPFTTRVFDNQPPYDYTGRVLETYIGQPANALA